MLAYLDIGWQSKLGVHFYIHQTAYVTAYVKF